jgi:NAD(P)H-hydrate epimerase
MLHSAALLTNEEARSADSATIAKGISGEALMENAGKAVVSVIDNYFKPCPVLVLCGIGNNGGDGFVIARILKERNWPVTVCVVMDAKDIKGDALAAKNKWQKAGGKVHNFSPVLLNENKLIIDAIFGTGLDRPIEAPVSDIITQVNKCPLPVIAVDIASGINGNSGAVMGVAVESMHTVTFTQGKPGHFLLPGKINTGQLHVADIGIVDDQLAPKHFLNTPALWKDQLPRPSAETHKYTRGHAIVIGGGISSTGASRMAALAGLRAGAGLVSIACTPDSLPVYASSLMAVMTKPITKTTPLKAMIDEKHVTAVLVGPGCGISDTTRDQTIEILKHNKPCVIDADAISAFQDNPNPLFSAIKAPTVLTPHEGEFERLFWVKGPKPERAIAAAKESNAVIVFKGNDTVIAHPDGRVAINHNAPVWLATAGAGDVLAGLITGFLAQGMPAFEAACTATWIHGEAACAVGPGLIAEDLPAHVPQVLAKLYL